MQAGGHGISLLDDAIEGNGARTMPDLLIMIEGSKLKIEYMRLHTHLNCAKCWILLPKRSICFIRPVFFEDFAAKAGHESILHWPLDTTIRNANDWCC